MNNTSSPARALPIWLVLVAALAAGAGLWLASRVLAPSAAAKFDNAVLYPQPRAIPDFTLARSDGKPLTKADWRGHWTIVYLGYASCPDVCPTTLAAFKQVWKDLPADQSRQVRLDFISVDPERDKPETLAKYVGFFHPDFVAATGSDEELTRLSRALGLVYSRGKDANGNVTVDHSGSAVIVDPQARLIGMFRPPFAPAAVAADLATLIARGS